MISAYHADGENLKYYIKKLNKFQPETLDGYTTSLIDSVVYYIAKILSFFV
jgi:phenylacetate-CoA ligase